jgi:putative oxidoreductase
VLRLFSMFPSGAPGFALLLLRVGVALTIFTAGWNSRIPVPLLLLLVLHCLFLCFGIFTPILATLSCVFELVSGVSMNHHSIVAVFSSSLDAAALAMLGPGAYSLDAHRFGHRVIRFPGAETSNRH